jgi:hypothetical protein
MIDDRQLQDAACIKLDVLKAMHFIAEAWRLVTPTAIKNCFAKCDFPADHVNTNYDRAMKFTENKENDWHSLQPLGSAV